MMAEPCICLICPIMKAAFCIISIKLKSKECLGPLFSKRALEFESGCAVFMTSCFSKQYKVGKNTLRIRELLRDVLKSPNYKLLPQAAYVEVFMSIAVYPIRLSYISEIKQANVKHSMENQEHW